MANTRSAAKQARGAVRRRAGNRVQLNTVRTSEKKIRALAKAGRMDEAAKLLSTFQSQIDRAAKKGVVHKNTASRHKARIAALLSPKKMYTVVHGKNGHAKSPSPGKQQVSQMAETKQPSISLLSTHDAAGIKFALTIDLKQLLHDEKLTPAALEKIVVRIEGRLHRMEEQTGRKIDLPIGLVMTPEEFPVTESVITSYRKHHSLPEFKFIKKDGPALSERRRRQNEATLQDYRKLSPEAQAEFRTAFGGKHNYAL